MKKLLIGLAIVLLAVLVVQWRSWSPAPPAPPAPPASPGRPESTSAEPAPASVESLLEAPPAKEEYVSVIERPLFLPDRRPPPEEPEEAGQPEPEDLTELDGMDLSAVVITPSTVSAWVRRPNSREAVRLRLGDDFEGWTVQTIEPDRLVLERQGDIDELILRDYENAPPPPPVRPPPVRRQRRAQPPASSPPAASENAPDQTSTGGPQSRSP